MCCLHLRELPRAVPSLALFACVVLIIVDVVLLNHNRNFLLLAGRWLVLTEISEIV